MKNYNKLESIGFVFLMLGALLRASEELYPMEALASVYGIARIAFWLGLLVWALGYMRRQKEEKEQSRKE